MQSFKMFNTDRITINKVTNQKQKREFFHMNSSIIRTVYYNESLTNKNIGEFDNSGGKRVIAYSLSEFYSLNKFSDFKH